MTARIEIRFSWTNTSIKIIIAIMNMSLLFLGRRWSISGVAIRIYAIEFSPSVKILPTWKISREYDFPVIPNTVEIMMFRIYNTPIRAIEFNSRRNLVILFIRKNEIGNINIQIAADAMLDRL